jgi:hypothetical protein
MVQELARLTSLAQSVGNAPQPAGAFFGISAVPLNAPITPTPDTVYADLSVATFAGSAAIPIAYTGPQQAPNEQPYMNTQLLNWICSATPGAPETIYAIAYFLPGAPNVLVGIDVLPTPVTISEHYDNLTWIGTVP